MITTSTEMTTRAGLLGAGVSDHEIQRSLRRGELGRIRPGSYLPTTHPAWEDAAQRHRHLVAASVPRLSKDAVVCDVSVRVLHYLPSWVFPLDRIHVTRRRAEGGRRGRRVHVHAASLEECEVVMVDAMAVTNVPRTLVDVARRGLLQATVSAADAALHRELLTRSDLVAAAAASPPRRGCAAARRAAALADGRSESVGESRSRVPIAQHGLPAPIPRWEVRDDRGRLVGRTDFGWPWGEPS